MISSRVGLRAVRATRALRSPAARNTGRRAQTTDASAAAEASQQSTFQKLWNSPVGVKTVHFWAPIMKWSLVVAGISDLWRPADKLSLTQNAALIATGAIWTRWCFVIRPKNILLAAVNFFVACTGLVQTTRILRFRASQNGSMTETIKEAGEGVVKAGEDAVKKGEEEAKAALKK